MPRSDDQALESPFPRRPATAGAPLAARSAFPSLSTSRIRRRRATPDVVSRQPIPTDGRPIVMPVACRCCRLVMSVVFALLLSLPLTRTARAERELIVPFHDSGHLVRDQLSGL